MTQNAQTQDTQTPTTQDRTATIERATKETTVSVSVNLDGTGTAEISTGIGMFDHLLTAFSHHSLIDITLTTTGDLHVDDHHTVEDSLLVLGTALDGALGDRAGITRYGDAAVPMDEAISTVAIDLGGRNYAVIDIPFRADRIGTLSTQMIEHGIEALSRTLRATINVSTTGRNDHHMAEASFKALARAMRSATESDPRRSGVPSTKGAL